MSRLKPPIKLEVRNKRGSNASYTDHTIRLSRTQYAEDYWRRLALVVHEFSHIVTRHKNGRHNILPHGKEFKATENRLLKLFGLSIKRKKAYARALYHDGIEIWHE